MTDYRSVEELDVYKNDICVARLRRLPKGCEFVYEPGFLQSSEPAIALHLPKNLEPLRQEGLANLPTYFAGLLPEGIMFNAVRNVIGAAHDDLFAILAATGADAIGDIDVRVPGETQTKSVLTLDTASKAIREIITLGKTNVNSITSIAGVQPKLSLGGITRATRRPHYIAKFDPPELPQLIGREYACMRLAKRCGLRAASVKIEANALVVTRFDRIYDRGSRSLHKIHVEDMLQALDLFPNSKYALEYTDLLAGMKRVGAPPGTILDAIRLYVFSYIVGNGDLHAKNVSLVLDEGLQWRLSPAYDIVCTLPYADRLLGADRMALALADEAYGKFSMQDFIDIGARFGLPMASIVNMITRIARNVLKYARAYVEQVIHEDNLYTILERATSLS